MARWVRDDDDAADDDDDDDDVDVDVVVMAKITTIPYSYFDLPIHPNLFQPYLTSPNVTHLYCSTFLRSSYLPSSLPLFLPSFLSSVGAVLSLLRVCALDFEPSDMEALDACGLLPVLERVMKVGR